MWLGSLRSFMGKAGQQVSWRDRWGAFREGRGRTLQVGRSGPALLGQRGTWESECGEWGQRGAWAGVFLVGPPPASCGLGSPQWALGSLAWQALFVRAARESGHDGTAGCSLGAVLVQTRGL